MRDANYCVLLVNDSLLRSFGIEDRIQYGQPLSAYFKPDFTQLMQGLDEQVIQSKQAAVASLPEGAAVRNPHAAYRVTSTPVYDKYQVLEGVVSVIIDQSELHLAEQNAYAGQQRYRHLFDAMPMPASVMRVKFTQGGVIDIRMLECNQAFMELMGSHEAPFEKSALETWPSFRDNALLEQVAQLMAGGPSFLHETFSALFGRQLEITFRRFGEDVMLMFLHDITEQRQAEQHILSLTHQLRGTQAEQQRRTELLLQDANQFMSTVVDYLDESTAVLGLLAETAPSPANEQLGRVAVSIQELSERTLRYTGVGLLPMEVKLQDLQALMEELFQELRPLYPFITFEAVELPSLVISRDALLSVVRNIVEHVCNGDPRSTPRTIIIRVVPKFMESGVCLEFHGFNLQRYFDAIGDEDEIEAGWDNFSSLHLAAVRRLLTYHGSALWLSRGPENSLRFILHSASNPLSS